MKKVLLASFICLSAICHAQLNLPGLSEDSLNSLINKGMNQSELAGMALGIIQDSELVYANGFGEKVKGSGDKVGPNTVFALASLSKAFTAAGIGLLVDEGKLSWDDRVIDHLPSFRMYDPYVTREMRVEDLLCHRNGYNTFDGDLLWYTTSYTSEEIMQRFANLAPKHGFRSSYGYQNTMFIVAALLIEAKTGMSWENFTSERILKPLGMNNSFTDTRSFPKGTELAYPHVSGKKIDYQNLQNAKGAVGVNSCINDLSVWANMWINKGKHKEAQFLSKKTWQKIITAHTAKPVSAGNWQAGSHFDNAALGWFTKDVNGHFVMRHSGGLPGFLLNLIVIPEKQTAIIVLTNGDKLLPFSISNVIQDHVCLNNPERDWVSDYQKFEDGNAERVKQAYEKRLAAKNKKLKASMPLDSLLGNYDDKMFGQAKVYKKNDKFYLELSPAKELFTAELVHWFGNTYQVKFSDPFLPEGYVSFSSDSYNKVEGFKIDLPNPDFHYYNLDFKFKGRD